MSVLISTSAGDIVVDLFVEDCPKACQNFLKLCTIKYYHNCLFYNLQANFIIQTGDPTGTGRGGNSIFGLLRNIGSSNGATNASKTNATVEYFHDEITPKIQKRLNKVGMVGFAHAGGKENTNKSDFFITLRGEDLHQLHDCTIFGEVAEGFEVLELLNALYCDGDGRPYQDVRIRHTHVLDDPTPSLPGFDSLLQSAATARGVARGDESPATDVGCYPPQEKVKRRIPYEEFGADGVDHSEQQLTEQQLDESIRRKEARSRAIVLEMTGDLPDADVKPPDEVLFVCKLNPVTTDEDLELIFSRFGKIKSCEVIRDHKTGDSLNYAFIEFETDAACIEAYEKMNNVLIDDRRIKVDFSQSVSKLWNRFLMKPRSDNQKQQQHQLEAGSKNDATSYYMPQPQMQPVKVAAVVSSSSTNRSNGHNDNIAPTLTVPTVATTATAPLVGRSGGTRWGDKPKETDDSRNRNHDRITAATSADSDNHKNNNNSSSRDDRRRVDERDKQQYRSYHGDRRDRDDTSSRRKNNSRSRSRSRERERENERHSHRHRDHRSRSPGHHRSVQTDRHRSSSNRNDKERRKDSSESSDRRGSNSYSSRGGDRVDKSNSDRHNGKERAGSGSSHDHGSNGSKRKRDRSYSRD